VAVRTRECVPVTCPRCGVHFTLSERAAGEHERSGAPHACPECRRSCTPP